jgi:exodeoxyribonuclease VII large subunit
MLVHVYGTPRLYQKTGKFSVFANQIVPAGEGALRLAFEKLKDQLEKEGLFDEQRKRTITKFPEKIGLITAEDSMAYSDFVKVLKHRMGGIKIFFYPVNVQGKNSVESIVRGI